MALSTRSPLPIGRNAMIAGCVLVAIFGGILMFMGRPPICTCGTIKLWHGVVNSAENSQHIADWYSFSHIIHGFLFYGIGWLVLRGDARKWALPLAVLVEGAWEVLENSPMIIDRYREATMAFGYSGDSVLNSLSDIGWMMFGFWLARKLPVWATVGLAITFELMTLYLIRDNLTLNILMLVYPIEAIKNWQAAL